MKAVLTAGLVSVVPVAWMIRSAIAVGFGVFVGPIVVAELVFLGAVYLLWRGLGADEPPSETAEPARPRPDRRGAYVLKPPRVSRPAAGHGPDPRSLVGRTGG